MLAAAAACCAAALPNQYIFIPGNAYLECLNSVSLIQKRQMQDTYRSFYIVYKEVLYFFFIIFFLEINLSGRNDIICLVEMLS
jgi:hypothetical protein